MAQPKRMALGRGLDSLISMDDVPAPGASAISDIDIDLISPNPDQPRTSFPEEELGELARSIGRIGVIQPLSVRKTGPEAYQIIAGERRWRAARMAGLTKVPAYVREASEAELTEMALIENVQRQDLNPIEIALTLRKLIESHHLTQEALSEHVGMNRATIANYLRLINLPAEVQLGLRDRLIDPGHGRALLSVNDAEAMLTLYRRTVAEGLSVRRVEALAKEVNEGKHPGKGPEKPQGEANHDFDLLRDHLSARFQTKVGFTCDSRGRGKITIPFRNEAELERIIAGIDNMPLQG